jgi:hypothetical protein
MIMLFPGEQEAIETVKELGRKYGYGNLIHHLRDAWSEDLQGHGISRDGADMAAGHICVWCKVDTRTGKGQRSEPIAEVDCSCGRYYLSVAGVAVAMQGDKCRANLPEEVCPPIPPEELAEATIGGKPAAEMPLSVVRFFRGDYWTKEMLEYVADKINEAAKSFDIAGES